MEKDIHSAKGEIGGANTGLEQAAQGGDDAAQPFVKRTQCGCFPHTDQKPEETEMLEHRFWCLYCCCIGLGCRCDLDPCMSRSSCLCWHCSCESADVVDKMKGICSNVWNCCCCAACICHFPLPKGTPACVCCNQKCCWKGGKPKNFMKGDEDFASDGFHTGGAEFGEFGEGPIDPNLAAQAQSRPRKRASITVVQEFDETSHILQNQIIPCFCCCLGCTEDYGKNLCGYNTKCGCVRCDARWGFPCFPGCKALTLCCGSYLQARCPTMGEAPCCVCCGCKCEGLNCTKASQICCPKRCPRCCERLKCCSCADLQGEICPCLRARCCCGYC